MEETGSRHRAENKLVELHANDFLCCCRLNPVSLRSISGLQAIGI